MRDLVPVRARDCTCPNTPHGEEGDIVFLLPTIPFEGGLEAEDAIQEHIGDPKLLVRKLALIYVRHGATGWNLLDEEGQAVPFDVDDILADYGFAYPVGEKADDLYSKAVLDPFRQRVAALSRTGRTNGAGTPPRSGRTPSRRRPSSLRGSAASKRSQAVQ